MPESFFQTLTNTKESTSMVYENIIIDSPEQLKSAEAKVDNLIKKGYIKEKDRQSTIESLFPPSEKGTARLMELVKKSWY